MTALFIAMFGYSVLLTTFGTVMLSVSENTKRSVQIIHSYDCIEMGSEIRQEDNQNPDEDSESSIASEWNDTESIDSDL